MPGKMNMKVKLTRKDRRRDGSIGGLVRRRTRQGINALKLVGDCMQAGGTVAAKTWHDEEGDEWMEASLDWSTAGEDAA